MWTVMARTMNYKKPKDTKKTLKRLLGYLGVHKIAVAIVAILVTVSSVASILGTYLLKPVVNRYILPGWKDLRECFSLWE